MPADSRTTIDRAPMSAFQWSVVAIMIGLNALDGFDVLSISFAAPGIARQWGIDRAALGLVLSMELIGMAAGSLVLGRVADRVGRRATILGCLGVMVLGIFGAASAGDVVRLSAWRLFTGVGIGGMLALVAQSFPAGLRATATGFAIGVGRGGSALAPAVAGGLFAAGIGLPAVSTIMASGSLLAAAALIGLRRASGARDLVHGG